jgi:hypothetical protein
MALTFAELESVTTDYFMADGRKAIDIYFNDSFLMDYTMNKKKGVWKRPNGGVNIRIPLEYDGQEGGFYNKTSALSSDDRESLNAAFFNWKHAYGNATIHRNDELQNAGAYAEVEMVQTKIAGAQKTARKKIAQQIYSNTSDGADEITGLTAMCFGAATAKYGNIAENDLVAADGTKPWAAVNVTAASAILLSVIRTLRSSAKVSDGPGGKPDIGLTTETLFNVISAILQNQQRFTKDTDTAKAGFTHLIFEQMLIAADDYCNSGYFFALNSAYVGWAIHSEGYFARTPWGDLLPNGTPAKTMKIFWDGNLVCTNRKAHAGQSGLT